jgi:RloB-like protein
MTRGQRSRASYARQEPVREPFDRILIVCEGGKSEPNYFRRLRVVYRLSNVEIAPATGNDPISVVSDGEAGLDSNMYDKAFCVFDRDGHSNYDAAVRRIANSHAGIASRLIAVTSCPCFEIWILLHFKYSSAPFSAVGGASACDAVIADLRNYFPAYAKGSGDVFDHLEPKLHDAIRNATLLQNFNTNSDSSNPATKIHELVSYLTQLKMG